MYVKSILQKSLVFIFLSMQFSSSVYSQSLTCDSTIIFSGITQLDGLTGSMPESNPIDEPAPFCGGTGNPQNMIWFSFISDTTSAILEITFSNCQGGGGFSAIQFGVYTSCTFEEYLPSACQGAAVGVDTAVVINMENMTQGEDYFLFIDGDLGTFCDYSIKVIDSVIPDPTSVECISNNCPSDSILCSLGDTLTFQPSGPSINADYIWTIAPGPPVGPQGITTQENFSSFTFDNPGLYEICLVIDNGNEQTTPMCYSINIFPDSDNDGTCDPDDLCPNDPEPGTECNDNDPCTINDVISSDCQCIGTFQDSDNDGTCDADDLCPNGPEPGTACDDEDDATINDLITEDCECEGEDPNAIDETLLYSIIYPNPVKNDLRIEADGRIDIKIYTLQGTLILKSKMNNKHTLDLSQLNTGIYILTLTNETARALQRLIKI